MVVWGGYDNVTGATNTGSLYDLFTDTWRSTTTTGAPEARDAHSAVWTGTQLIVWGGSRDAPGYGLLSSGGLYTPGHVTDACDPNDGNILVWLPDGATVEWQQEAGFEAFNVYLGDLTVLKTSGIYTQDPGTVPLAGRACGLVGSTTPVVSNPPSGKGVFFLVTGVHLGVEGSLGTNSAGVERRNDHPCP